MMHLKVWFVISSSCIIEKAYNKIVEPSGMPLPSSVTATKRLHTTCMALTRILLVVGGRLLLQEGIRCITILQLGPGTSPLMETFLQKTSSICSLVTWVCFFVRKVISQKIHAYPYIKQLEPNNKGHQALDSAQTEHEHSKLGVSSLASHRAISSFFPSLAYFSSHSFPSFLVDGMPLISA